MSEKFSLNATDIKVWLKWAVVFSLGVFTIYAGQITGLMSVNEGAFEFSYLIPNTFTMGAIVAYVIERIQDLARRFISS